MYTLGVSHMEKLAFKPAEAAQILGIHLNTLYRAIARGEIKAAKLGSRTLIPRAEIERLLSGGALTQR